MNENQNTNAPSTTEKQLGRNEPCPCHSGKKYKRCCGIDAKPLLGSVPDAPSKEDLGFDPNSIDPQMISQLSNALSRLPKGQMQRLQSLMQKAMSGKDVSEEAAMLEKTLPLELQSMIQGFNPAAFTGTPDGNEASSEVNVDTTIETPEKKKGLSRFWSRFKK